MRIKLAIAVLISTLTLTACGGTGVEAPTRNINQVTDGVDGTINENGNLIYLRNVQISLAANGDATLIGTIINENDTKDALISISVNGATSNVNYPLVQNKPVIFGGDSANATLTIPASKLVAGNRIPINFFFGVAGETSLDALVVGA